MTTEVIKKLLEAGVHFGHQTRRWNPKMKKFIFGDRGGIYIIDLEKTGDCLEKGRDFARDIAAKGGRFLFIGTKKQAQDVVKEEALRSDMFYVNNRWMGGLLTNFETVKKSIRKLQDIERMEKEGVFQRLTKKEVSVLNKERVRLLADLGGIRDMVQYPDAVFVVDVKHEEIAVREANRLNIPVIAMIDTNSDPDPIQYPIPSNDDAVKSIRIVMSMVVDGIIEGRKEFKGTSTRKDEKELAPEAVAASVPAPSIDLLVPDVDLVIPAIIKESLSEALDKYDVVTGEKISDNKKRAKKGASEKE